MVIYKKKGEGYEVLGYFDGSMKTIGFVMKYCTPRYVEGSGWSAVDMKENSETFSTRKAAGAWLCRRAIELRR